MSRASSEDIATLLDRVDAVERALDALADAFVDGEEESLLAHAESLWASLDELEDVWRTVDVTEAADAIDFSKLAEEAELEDIAEGALDSDEPVLDLSDVRTAVELRELWDAVDMTQLAGETDDLDDVLASFTSDDDEVGLVEGPRMEADPGTRQAYMEEVVTEAAEEFRSAMIEGHQQFRDLWEANQERFGRPGRQPNSLNPSAYSTLPPGPVVDSASTRLTTVPQQVRHSRSEYSPRRIYGRRFTKMTAAERSDGKAGEAGHAESSDAATDASSDGTTDAAADEPPTITRHGANE